MNTENTKYLLGEYPKLYYQHSLPITDSCMAWLFEHGDGWFNIIDDLSEKLTQLDAKLGTETQALQVKEKYGTLRFYISGGTDAHENEIDKAEKKSSKTCENCGARGKLRRGGWLVTRCDACEEKHSKGYKA